MEELFNESEVLNTVNDVQEPNVEAHEPASDDGATTEVMNEAEVQEPAKPAQTAEENAAFAKIRREAESKAELKAAELAQKKIDDFYKSNYAGQVNPYNGKPIDSEASYKEFERMHKMAQMAEKSGITVQEQQELIQNAMLESPEYRKATEEAQKLKEEAESMREQLNQITFQKDLEAVKKYNPKETAETVEELGLTFMKARAMDIDPVTAYEIAKAEKQRLNPAPPSMGDVNAPEVGESEFYTFEQLKNLSPQEVHNNWEKVQRSRKHLKI